MDTSTPRGKAFNKRFNINEIRCVYPVPSKPWFGTVAVRVFNVRDSQRPISCPSIRSKHLHLTKLLSKDNRLTDAPTLIFARSGQLFPVLLGTLFVNLAAEPIF